MKLLSLLFATIIASSAFAQEVYTVIANPGENASHSVRLNWHSDTDSEKTFCFYTECSDTDWSNAKKVKAKQKLCTAYDSMYSKNATGENIYEKAVFMRNTVEIKKLEPGMKYMYRIGTDFNDGEVRYFKTAPGTNNWTAAIISDFHAYTPLPKRVKSAMSMLEQLEKQNKNEFDFILHAGDIIAWGGSYSFWRDLYSNEPFKKYLWAGVNGNHDNMDRTNKKNSNDFFRFANNNPQNGYNGEKGVCYHFTYGNTLFIMLNNESMRNDEGLRKAQKWVKKVVNSNKNAKFVVVMEHYQWFFGTNGKTSQYERWKDLFDECDIDIAIGANNHIYARTNALFKDSETDGSKGTIYVQTPSSDNERGQELKEWTDNKDIIKCRWTEGTKTVGAIIMKADDNHINISLYDRFGNVIDDVTANAKNKQ